MIDASLTMDDDSQDCLVWKYGWVEVTAGPKVTSVAMADASVGMDADDAIAVAARSASTYVLEMMVMDGAEIERRAATNKHLTDSLTD